MIIKVFLIIPDWKTFFGRSPLRRRRILISSQFFCSFGSDIPSQEFKFTVIFFFFFTLRRRDIAGCVFCLFFDAFLLAFNGIQIRPVNIFIYLKFRKLFSIRIFIDFGSFGDFIAFNRPAGKAFPQIVIIYLVADKHITIPDFFRFIIITSQILQHTIIRLSEQFYGFVMQLNILLIFNKQFALGGKRLNKIMNIQSFRGNFINRGQFIQIFQNIPAFGKRRSNIRLRGITERNIWI